MTKYLTVMKILLTKYVDAEKLGIVLRRVNESTDGVLIEIIPEIIFGTK